MTKNMDTLLIPVDGSEYSLQALDVAAELAQPLGANLVICHVVDLAKASAMSAGEPLLLEGCYEEVREEAERIVADAVKRVGSAVPTTTTIVQGAPTAEIQRLAEELKPRFIVIGSHGRTGLNRALLGSVAENVARGCCVPVMIVPSRKTSPKARHVEAAHA